MKRKRHTDEQILVKLRRVDELLAEGKTVQEAAKQIEVTVVTYYRWKKQFGGVNKDEVRRGVAPVKSDTFLDSVGATKLLRRHHF